MDASRLATLLEQPEVQNTILRDYDGGYSLGLTRNPEKKEEVAIRVRIEAEDVSHIPSKIILDGEPIPIVVNPGFKLPEPLKK